MVTISINDTNRQAVVVFSKNYLPISKVNLKRAIILLVTGKAEPLDFVSEIIWEVRSPSIKVQVPAYIRLNYGSERVWKVPPVSRREILKRDRDRCQYCGSKKQLTIDHIIPRSKGGKHSWDNVVIACATCNSRKGDRTLEQASMLLLTEAKAPAHPAIVFAEKFWQSTGT
jgi:5-methylcytosine-specific restriction endonuclease McrA